MMSTPPILLTIFNRPDHTARVFDAIRKARPRRMFIHADGPRSGTPGDIALCEAARKHIQVDWECDVQWTVRTENLGCKNGMHQAVSWFFEQVESGIILEDDCIPEPTFFPFCAELLERYKDDPRVFGISGNHFVDELNLAASYYFLKTTHIWGWASWRRSWTLVDLRATDWPRLQRSDAMGAFLKEAGPRAFWAHILDDLHSGLGDTWSGAVIYTMLKHDMLGIHPHCNLVSNHGFGSSGVHKTPENHKLARVPAMAIDFPLRHPGLVRLSVDFDRYVAAVWDLGAPVTGGTVARQLKEHAPSMGQWLRLQFPTAATATEPVPASAPVVAGRVISPSPAPDADVSRAPGDGLHREAQPDMQAGQRPAPMGKHAAETVEPHPVKDLPSLGSLFALDDKDFLSTAYRRILLREPDAEGLHYYSSRLRAGVSRTQILGQLSLSGESGLGRSFYPKVRLAYRVIQARKLPAIGWIAEIACALGKFHLRELLHFDGARFVSQAYAAVLGREPDPLGMSHYLARLDQGASKAEILADLSLSGDGRMAGHRVAGLSAMARAIRLRRLPLVRTLVDILQLPSGVADALRQARGARAVALRQGKAQHDELRAIHSSVAALHEATRVLAEGVDAQNTRVAAQIHTLSLESAAAVDQARGEIAGLAHAMSSGIAQLAQVVEQRLQDAAVRLDGLQDTGELLKTRQSALARDMEQHRSDQSSLRNEISSRLAQMATEISAPMVGRLALAESAHNALRKQIDRHVLGLHALVNNEFAVLGQAVPRGLDATRQLMVEHAHLADKARTELESRLRQHMEELAIAAAAENTALARQLEASGTSLLVALERAQTAIEAQLAQSATQALQTQDALRLQLGERMEAGAASTTRAIADVGQQIHEHTLGFLAASNRLQSELSRGFGHVATGIAETQETLSHRITTSTLGTTEAVTRESAALLQQVHAAAAELAAALNLSENTLATRMGDVLQLQEAIGRQVVDHSRNSVASISQGHAAMLQQVRLAAEELSVAFTQSQTRLADQLKTTETALRESIPLAGEATQKAFDRMTPQLGRIELYSMTAARRMAIRCGANVLMVRTVVGYVLCPDQDHALIATLVEAGDLEPGTRQLIQRLLQAGDTFVDVGANIGMHTIAAARAMGGKGRVIAVEPHPVTARLLGQCAWMNGFADLVDVHAAAAAEKAGERTLHMGPTSGHHSLFPLDAAEVEHVPPIQVQATTLDKIVPAKLQVTLIKIDAEGAELEIMGGAARTLKRNQDVGIIAEFGGSHLRRTGTGTRAWLDTFTSLGFDYRAIHADNGVLRPISIEELDALDSINLFFARPTSPLWSKAGGVS